MAHLHPTIPGPLRFPVSLRPVAVAAIIATALAVFLAGPARSTVVVDLHYQGLDEIELADLPADGRITLDVDLHWDGTPAGLVGIGFGVLFDPSSATFVSGTGGPPSTFFADMYGGEGLYTAGPPKIIAEGYPAGDSGRRIWPSNLISSMGGIRLPAPDHPGSELGAYQLTFDVRDVSTFEVLLGVGDAALFFPVGGTYTTCYPDGLSVGAVSYDAAQCVAAGLVAFDGFRVVDGDRVGETPMPIFDLPHAPEPGASLLIGLGLAWLAGRRPKEI
jgi:hypothetical protein